MKKEKYARTKMYANLTPADRVRIACELLEIPQVEIARRADLKPSQLSEIIHGRRGIGKYVAKRLSKVLHIPFAKLLGADETEEIRQKNVEAVLRRIRQRITRSESIGENTGRILLKEVDEAIQTNRAS